LSPFACLSISYFAPQPHSLVYCYVFQTPCWNKRVAALNGVSLSNSLCIPVTV
jgi:hypothetical protein